MRVLLVDTLTGRAAMEVAVSDIEATDEANGYSDSVATLRVDGSPDLLPTTQPWLSTLALVDDKGNVLWAGPIIRREGGPGTGTIILTARQWEGWLDRVYLTDEYDDEGEADAATAVATRLSALNSTVESHPWAMRPPLPIEPEALAGVTLAYSWRSSIGSAAFTGEPPSVLDDIRALTEQGVRFAYVPTLTRQRLGFTLVVDTYDLEPSLYLQVGHDIADLTLATDANGQVTHWLAVGEDAGLTASASASGEQTAPLLMSTASFPSVATQDALTPLVNALLAQSREPLVVAREVTVSGIRALRAGDMVQIDVPPGPFPELWPTGASWQMRASNVRWHWRPGQSPTTTLTLTQPINNESVWAAPRISLVSYLAELERRTRRQSSRRMP